MMGLIPERVPRVAETAKFLGNLSTGRIDQLAVQLVSPDTSFQTVREFEQLRAKASYSPAEPR